LGTTLSGARTRRAIALWLSAVVVGSSAVASDAIGALTGTQVSASAVSPAVPAPRVEVLVPGTAMHAVEGITFDEDGVLYGTSIHGQRVYRIDTRSGRVTTEVESPAGESDDVAVGPRGTAAAGILAWTAQRSGEVRIRRPGGAVEVLLRDAPRVNPIAFRADGRLFAAQVGAGDDTLWELDAVTNRPPRRVASGRARLNGFGFGADGRLYAPNFGADRLLAIDVDSGEHTPIATGVGAPAAAKVDARGNVWSVDYLTGDLWRTELRRGRSGVMASFPAPLDSLAIARDGVIYLSSAADGGILAFDPRTRRQRVVVRGHFTMTLGMALTMRDGREALAVADPFGYRYVDTASGAIHRPAWTANRGASYAIAANERVVITAYALGGSLSARIRVIDRRDQALIAEHTSVAVPRGVLLDGDDALVVADFRGGSVVRIVGKESAPLATDLGAPVGLARTADGGVLVTDFAGGRVLRIAPRAAPAPVTVLATGLDRPTGVVAMRDGRLAVVEAEAGRVIAIAPGARTVLAEGLRTSLAGLDLPADTPAGIASGADGSLYLSCPGDNTIVRIRL
jgi:sugar lactone lactonase YvrE